MTKREIEETLEKQLRLLSERSMVCPWIDDLALLTDEMVKVANLLITSRQKSCQMDSSQ